MKKRIDFVRTYFIHPRRGALLYALIVFTVLLILWWFVGAWVEGQLLQDERKNITKQVDTFGTSLTLSVNQRLMIISSVQSYLEAEIRSGRGFRFDNLDHKEEMDYFASGLSASTAGVRNIAIAPDGIVLYVYPYEENKAVLGYEPALDKRPNVREEVRRAIETGEIVLSLPYELIQGGQGLIARQAIYTNDGSYWGLANVVLDVPPLLEEAGISPMPAGLILALRDQSGQLFFGSEDIYSHHPVTYSISLPEGSWELAGVPSAGWRTGSQTTMRFYHVMGLSGIIAISLVVYLFINRRERLTYLVEQRTQELNQSNQTLITVLEGIDADVYVADFDTHEVLFANRHLRESFKDILVGKICHEVFRHESDVCANCKKKLLLDANGYPSGTHIWEDQNPITKRWYKNADRAIHWYDGRHVHLQIATDITELKQASDVIRENEERYRNLFDSVPVGIYRSTPDGRFLDGNPALIKILGYPDQETMLSANIENLYLDKDDRIAEMDLIEQVDLVNNHRLQLRRYDGTVIWVQDSVNVVRNSKGETIYYYGRLEDITKRVKVEETLLEAERELKALVQEKDILLAEIHHRVKNNMQVIISLLSLQASEIEDGSLKVIYEESRNRIKSMALVHEQLYRSKEYARIEFGSYIDQLATTLFHTYQLDSQRIQLHIEAEDVYLDLEQAIPCGLLLNELITNTLKHAFPIDQKGQLWIKLHLDGDGVALTFRDNGVGISADLDLENIQSLGLHLVHLLTVHDLHGSIKIEQEKGTTIRIKFPLNGKEYS